HLRSARGVAASSKSRKSGTSLGMDKRQPADNNAAYYYHFDGLGSVVALSNSNGDSCQSYEYSAYGQVAASDPNHPNPYMFTGRRFDIETGLYYYRARYYNPHIGRFMQTDPVGYGYTYCSNNPLGRVDPFGLMDAQITIPTICITDDPYNNPYGVSFTDIVKWWLNDVGFYDDEYSHWDFNSVSITGKDFVIDLHCEDDTLEPEIDYGIWNVGSAKLVTFNGIGRLDSRDRTLNLIIKDTVNEINQWWGKKELHLWKLVFKVDTPFHHTGIDNWRYKNNTYHKSDINYIAEGHAMMHLKIDPVNALSLVFGWKVGAQHSIPSRGTLYWFLKVYIEYPTRSMWKDWIKTW
ncbi:MAG: RHS repeat-associated core domain-containing protein, partial [Phycisphaerae bacterium]